MRRGDNRIINQKLSKGEDAFPLQYKEYVNE